MLSSALVLIPALATGQAIQRCEGGDGRISYANAECPAGTRTVRSLAPAQQPTPEAQNAARERAQRERVAAEALAAQRRTPAPSASGAYVSVEEARRASDCSYLRAELESSRRLRNVLTTRPYYSTEDVEQMDARTAALAADYRRHCSR